MHVDNVSIHIRIVPVTLMVIVVRSHHGRVVPGIWSIVTAGFIRIVGKIVEQNIPDESVADIGAVVASSYGLLPKVLSTPSGSEMTDQVVGHRPTMAIGIASVVHRTHCSEI